MFINYLRLIKTSLMKLKYMWRVYKDKRFEETRMQAQIIMHAHSIEKGLSISSPRECFGIKKISEMVDLISEYHSSNYDMNSSAIFMANDALNAYIEYHNSIGVENEQIAVIKEKYNKLSYIVPKHETKYGGVIKLTREKLKFDELEIENFINTRHSVRDFSDIDIDILKLNRAIELAGRCPTACNRQAYRVYILSKEKIAQIPGYLNGIGGFENSVKKYIAITAKLSSYKLTETNQYIVSASIFAGYLSLTLHLYGMGSCLLERSLTFNDTMINVSSHFKLPEDEQIICLMGIGNLKDEFVVPISNRFNYNEIVSQIE